MRYFVELSYNGKNYHGWQVQPDASSVQETLNKSISTLLREPINVVGAGRTDAGVHASQLFAHFDTVNLLNTKEFKDRLNSFLPSDIAIQDIFAVKNDAHARFDAVSRSYEYRIWLGKNPFLVDTTWQLYNRQLDVEKMNDAVNEIYKYSDFKCFSKSRTDVKTYYCKILNAVWKREGDLLTFYITADRFLRNMVRAIVGTLTEVGFDKITKTEFEEIIQSRDRKRAGFSVPPQGLFLTKVEYPLELFNLK